MRNTVRPCVPLDGKKVLLVGQYFAIPRLILLLRHVFIYVSGRNLCVIRQLLFYPSPFTFWLGMPINTRVSRGEGWNVPLTRVNVYYTEVYGVLEKGKKRFVFQKKLPHKNMSEFASRYFFGIFLCSYHYFLYLCPQKGVFKQ